MFFQVDHPSLDAFGPVLRSVVKMAFTGGLQALASLGLTMEAIKIDTKARSRFLRGCHRGYDKAQQRIGLLVIELQERIAALQGELKEARRKKDPSRSEIETQIRVLRNRQLALRRVADAILCVITRLDTWVLRRLVLDRRIRVVDPRVLRKTLQVAARRNSEDRRRFSLVTDLTTVVQIGDLVEVSSILGTRDGGSSS